MKAYLIYILTFTTLSIAQADTGIKFPYQSEEIKSILCELPKKYEPKPVKVLFVIDGSGSNVKNDPQAKTRTEIIQNFVNKYKSVQSISWGFSFFKSKYYSLATNHSLFTSDYNLVKAQIDKIEDIPNFNRQDYLTDFKVGLDGALDQIINEQDSDQDTIYFVVFISDGGDRQIIDAYLQMEQGKTDAIKVSGTASLNSRANEIFTSAVTIGLVENKSIQLNTILYGDAEYGTKAFAVASDLMQTMAKAGQGSFADFNTNKFAEIDKLIHVNQLVCR